MIGRYKTVEMNLFTELYEIIRGNPSLVREPGTVTGRIFMVLRSDSNRCSMREGEDK